MVSPWRIGEVRVGMASYVTGTHLGFRAVRGLVRGPWGLFRDGGLENDDGEVLRWNLTHTPSGREVAHCVSPRVAQALAADLDALGVDWTAVTEHGRAREQVGGDEGLRRLATVLARWGSDGQITLTERIRRRACEAAGLASVEASA